MRSSVTHRIHALYNLGNFPAVCVHFKYHTDKRCFLRVNLKLLVLIYLESQRNISTGAQAALSIEIHATLDFLRQFITIILGVAHHHISVQLPGGRICKHLCRRKQANIVFFDF